MPDCLFRWILHFHENDKMIYLIALENMEAKIVALVLLPLSLQQGTPASREA
jgi:hypothetical protein